MKGKKIKKSKIDSFMFSVCDNWCEVTSCAIWSHHNFCPEDFPGWEDLSEKEKDYIQSNALKIFLAF